MKIRILVATFGLLVIAGVLGWTFRIDLLLAIAERRAAADEVAPAQSVAWQKAAPQPRDGRPNIVFILLDDLGINDLSTFGGGVAGGRVQTPHIDRLAAEGAVFRQAYAGTASCAPSRAMLLTGRYPTRTGFEFTPTPDGMGRAVSMIANSTDSGLPPVRYDREAADRQPPYEAMGLPSSEVTLAEVLKASGYYTAHIGKWHLGRSTGSRPTDQGFDDSLLMASGLFLPEDHPDVVNARLPFDPVDRFLWARMRFAASFNNGPWFEPGGYLTDYWTDEAVSIIREHRDEPFFLYLAHWGVHTPLQATRSDYDAVGTIQPHRLRVYAAMVRALDRSVGRILAVLDEEGLAEDTLVVLSSDNGGAGYLGLAEINAPYRGWKLTLYEGGLRVPLFLRWPGRVPAGTVVEPPVAHIDLLPTLAAAAGAPLPTDRIIDGRDLLPIASGASTEEPHEALYWHSAHYAAVRRGDWKLQRSERPAFRRLYDLVTDPTEEVNVAADHPLITSELDALLDAHLADRRPPLYLPTLEAPVALDKTLAEPVSAADSIVYWPN
ncbi:sulfatase-like hydrolase/transferase [Pseudohaliea rubra]|uniref:Arylsulfatase n=1 Tax=Pseudohaliea rubra DSM 19751 TaxID=1265313 RepID=A0A095VQ74_9GAMM|nr:sulfatase-like hydrolase/transferase [Pseudohaliea rubra]KGE03525.1 Arylsulfatase [Pseudohaliea rubra DSM 19751]